MHIKVKINNVLLFFPLLVIVDIDFIFVVKDYAPPTFIINTSFMKFWILYS